MRLRSLALMIFAAVACVDDPDGSSRPASTEGAAGTSPIGPEGAGGRHSGGGGSGTGATGATGAGAFSGGAGSSGAAGSVGVAGFPGSAGSGVSGSGGVTASAGHSGFAGVAGHSGFAGSAGDSGSAGHSDVAGAGGVSGGAGTSAGAAGANGGSGAGVGGDTGAAGASGFAGAGGAGSPSTLTGWFDVVYSEPTVSFDGMLGACSDDQHVWRAPGKLARARVDLLGAAAIVTDTFDLAWPMLATVSGNELTLTATGVPARDYVFLLDGSGEVSTTGSTSGAWWTPWNKCAPDHVNECLGTTGSFDSPLQVGLDITPPVFSLRPPPHGLPWEALVLATSEGVDAAALAASTHITTPSGPPIFDTSVQSDASGARSLTLVSSDFAALADGSTTLLVDAGVSDPASNQSGTWMADAGYVAIPRVPELTFDSPVGPTWGPVAWLLPGDPGCEMGGCLALERVLSCSPGSESGAGFAGRLQRVSGVTRLRVHARAAPETNVRISVVTPGPPVMMTVSPQQLVTTEWADYEAILPPGVDDVWFQIDVPTIASMTGFGGSGSGVDGVFLDGVTLAP